MNYIKPFEAIGINDIPLVGGKNASLGEMIQHLADKGVTIPSGFALTADAYRYHLEHNNLIEPITALLGTINKNDLVAFAAIGKKIRTMIAGAPLPDDLVAQIKQAYQILEQRYGAPCDVAVRSSATAEDLPEASFAGQQDTYLNIRGDVALLDACTRCFASLFNDRAISYRIDHGFDHMSVALSIGVQKMIRSDLACSGVIFTLDTESGFKDVVFITASYGLGENVVQGSVNPDEFYVHKPTLLRGYKPLLKKRLGSKAMTLVYRGDDDNDRNWILKQVQDDKTKTPFFFFNYFLKLVKGLFQNQTSAQSTINIDTPADKRAVFALTDEEVLSLARQALIIEEYYSARKDSWAPMDIEWAKDGIDGKLYIVQSRPETVYANKQHLTTIDEYILNKKNSAAATVLATGKSVGRKIISGVARVIQSSAQMAQLQPGEILVTEMTDPDWEPIMKIAGGIITDRGGRTCHAAIISRELGIPAIVGTHDATTKIPAGQAITLDGSNGDIGLVYQGAIPFTINTIQIATLPKPPVDIMMNVGNPDEAFSLTQLPNDGVGLARLEFIINTSIQIHPMALVEPDKVTDPAIRARIEQLTHGYSDKKQFFIDKLAQEAGTIAAAFYPKPVIIRMSDFKSNEYRKLIGGSYFEPTEENPMIGFRGASRYHHPAYQAAFALECLAMKKIREVMGLNNVVLMIPFVRTVDEGKAVINIMAQHGLVQGNDGLQVYMMCEIPSNVILIEQFATIFDGFSIGSNDLTQMTLAVDRDSELVASIFDERNEAVKRMLVMALAGAKATGKKIGICGQAPSDYPEFARFLIEHGIDSLSLNPDAVVKTIVELGEK